jgi:hypothetical protein
MAGGENETCGLKKCLQHYPGYGKTPNNPEKRPAEYAMKNAKRQRCIFAGDKNKDRGMLDDSKTALGLANWPCTIKRGGKIKKGHGCGKDTRADNKSGILLPYCIHEEKWCSEERADQPQAVVDAVGDFFPLRLRPRLGLERLARTLVPWPPVTIFSNAFSRLFCRVCADIDDFVIFIYIKRIFKNRSLPRTTQICVESEGKIGLGKLR